MRCCEHLGREVSTHCHISQPLSAEVHCCYTHCCSRCAPTALQVYWWAVEARVGKGWQVPSPRCSRFPTFLISATKIWKDKKKLKSTIVGLFARKPWPCISFFCSSVQAADEDLSPHYVTVSVYYYFNFLCLINAISLTIILNQNLILQVKLVKSHEKTENLISE